ncbi:MAG: phenylacetate--CoA ligase family protein [Candidatus Binatia bacterium]
MIAAANRLFVLPALVRHPRATKDDIVGFQNRSLRRLIRHAYRNVPYYRRLFDAHGISPEDVRTVADLPRVPVTTRATLQALGAGEILARGTGAARLDSDTTAGSSGRPITIRRHWIENRILAAIRMRAMREFGLRSRERIAIVATATHRRDEGASRIRRWVDALRTERWHRIDNELPPAMMVARLRALGVAVLVGYPGTLASIARSIDQAELRALALRYVSTGGEVLTAAQRADIVAGFGVPVHDTYGSHEFDLMASECPRVGGYHVADDGLILEVVQDGRAVAEGERGEVVGTGLHGYAMPFIRYVLGDLVTKGAAACPCGQPFSTIGEITGRMLDAFPLPDGRIVHPYGVFVPIRNRSPWIRQFQVTQTSLDRFVMKVVAAPAPTAAELALVREMATAKLGREIVFEVEMVPEIPFEPSGKFRVYRSQVRSEYDP